MATASPAAELLYALLGYTGRMVVRRGGDGGAPASFGLADGIALDPCERQLVLGVLSLGECYVALDSFLKAQLFDWRELSAAGDGRDPHVVALATGLEECLAPYRARVLELEQQLLRGALPLTELQLGLTEYSLTLPLMRSLVDRVQAEGIGAAPLLDMLAEAAAGAVASGRQCIEVLLWHVQRVFLSTLATWLLHGELLPASAPSFFVQRVAASADPSPAHAAFSSSSPPALPSEEGWGEFEVNVGLKPRLLPMKLAERALFIGKAVRVLRAAEAAAHAASAAGSAADKGGAAWQGRGGTSEMRCGASEGGGRLGEPGSRSSAQEMRLALEGFAEELGALSSARRLSTVGELSELLGRLSRLASRLLWRHLTYECALDDLLTALKGYFLLGRGELFHRLVLELRAPMAALPTSRLDLGAALAHATAGAEPDRGGYVRRLALELPAVERGVSAYDSWRRMGLRLPVASPLSLLVHAAALESYSALFSFLFTVKRVQMELHAAWASQMEKARPAGQRAHLLPVWRLRAHMAFLIDNLQYYLQVDVLDAQWQALSLAAAECEDFEALAATHQATLSVLSSQCFLQAGSVSSALHQIFQLCLALCTMIEHSDAGLRNPVAWAAQTATVRREFGRQTAFLLAFLSNVASPQASPHLGQLLLRLNFNERCSMLQASA